MNKMRKRSIDFV